MSKRLLGFAVLAAFVAGFAVNAADEKKEAAKFEAKCLVAGDKAAKEDKFSEYKGGKVYFCCDGCKGNFDKDPAKFAVKANAQLVSTKQAKQTKCPIAGTPCKEDKFTTVAGVKVHFCCDGCKGKVEKEKGDAQAALVFSDEAFKKGFEVPKK